MTATSWAVAKAAANSLELPLYRYVGRTSIAHVLARTNVPLHMRRKTQPLQNLIFKSST